MDPCRRILPRSPCSISTRDGAMPPAAFQSLQMEQTKDLAKPTGNTAISIADTQIPHLIELLNKLMEDHAGLRTLIQHQHAELNMKIEHLSQLGLQHANAVDSQNCAAGSQATEGLQENEKNEGSYTFRTKISSKSSDMQDLATGSLGNANSEHKFAAWLETILSFTIVINAFTMMAGLQLKGLYYGSQLGMRSNDVDWNEYQTTFEVLEAIFNGIYLFQLLCSLYIYRMNFAKDWFNLVDGLIVVICCFHSFVLLPLNYKGTFNISVLRLFRIARIARLFKVLRFSQHFAEMRVLLRTLGMGMQGMFWSVVLLGALIIGGGILMAQLALHFLEGDYEYIDADRKKWLFEHFGTTASSVYTMFESTFTGGWRFYSRPLIYEVSYMFAVVWVTWVICVNFTTMRVVAALFLKQTMAVAALDEERLAMQHLKEKQAYAQALNEIFESVDSSGDGSISQKEFNSMVKDENVMRIFAKLKLDMDEVVALFGVLSSDDGEADYAEFLSGAMKMNTSARTIDSVQVMHNQLKMQRDITAIMGSIKAMEVHTAHTRTTPG